MLDECFTAAAGKGAQLNGQPIRVSQVTALADALACTGFPPNVTPQSPDLRVFLDAIFCCQGVRRTGSAALNFCYLASGRFDIIWNFATKIWDIAAGALLVQEAGGVVTATDGGPFVLEKPSYLATANATLQGQMIEVVARALGDKALGLRR